MRQEVGHYRLVVLVLESLTCRSLLGNVAVWLYEGNSKEEYIENLKRAILECIANPDEVTRRGKNARKKAEKYTWQEKNKKYQMIYESLLRK